MVSETENLSWSMLSKMVLHQYEESSRIVTSLLSNVFICRDEVDIRYSFKEVFF